MIDRYVLLVAASASVLTLGCAGSHERHDPDASTPPAWSEDPWGLVGVSAERSTDLLRSDFGVVRTVASAEAPIRIFGTNPAGSHAVLLLDRPSAPVSSRLRVVSLRDGSGPETSWAGPPEHACAASGGELVSIYTGRFDGVGVLIGCETPGAEAEQLARLGSDGVAEPLPLPAGCRVRRLHPADGVVAVDCGEDLRWLDVRTGAVMRASALGEVVQVGPLIDGPHLVRDGDAHRLVRIDDAGETSSSLAVPGELDVDFWGLSISPDGAWAFGRLSGATEGSPRESMLFDTTTGELAEHDGCGSAEWQDHTVSFARWSHSRLIAGCQTGVWLADPAEPEPVRLADTAYDASVSHDGSRVLIVGARDSRVVAPDETDLGPAWPSTPEAQMVRWRRW